ncbi:hypothetical protein Afil01_40060 [Actinorhabdospora filicis]|uniref:Uncharacterized protein n=1 Tax=Actinorhabdospora filicis TaxID=1785913 RepID=A0A9W6SLL1_9ACTN|nr:hypothetical protein Afil01_40060 [Actinorhabdospora filicis]
MPAGDVAGPVPPDYRTLIAATGPGTLTGLLRLLAPCDVPDFDMAAEDAVHSARIEARRASGVRTVPLTVGDHPAAARFGAAHPRRHRRPGPATARHVGHCGLRS